MLFQIANGGTKVHIKIGLSLTLAPLFFFLLSRLPSPKGQTTNRTPSSLPLRLSYAAIHDGLTVINSLKKAARRAICDAAAELGGVVNTFFLFILALLSLLLLTV